MTDGAFGWAGISGCDNEVGNPMYKWVGRKEGFHSTCMWPCLYGVHFSHMI